MPELTKAQHPSEFTPHLPQRKVPRPHVKLPSALATITHYISSESPCCLLTFSFFVYRNTKITTHNQMRFEVDDLQKKCCTLYISYKKRICPHNSHIWLWTRHYSFGILWAFSLILSTFPHQLSQQQTKSSLAKGRLRCQTQRLAYTGYRTALNVQGMI